MPISSLQVEYSSKKQNETLDAFARKEKKPYEIREIHNSISKSDIESSIFKESFLETFQQELCEEFGSSVFEAWFKSLAYIKLEEDILYLSLPSSFMRDWVSTQYGIRLKTLFKKHLPYIKRIDFSINKSSKNTSEASLAATRESQGSSSPIILLDQIGSGLDPRFTFENFVVGKPNELAYAAACRVSEETQVTFNPLFLYGGVGLGKTHLMHAIAWRIRQSHPKRKVIYLSAEKFMYQFIRALRQKDMVSFKEYFRSVDVLMIDDVQFICGKESTQEEFFHTFNALVDQNRQIIISADKSPSDLQGVEERMRSRLGWGLVADIHPTTYELRLGILQSKTESMGFNIPDKILEFIAHKITSNIRELEGALTRIVAHSSFVGREITLEMVQDTLKDLLRANDKRVTLEDIQKKVIERYGLKTIDLQSSSRLRSIARPRQLAMYLAKVLTTKSFPEIGRFFGGRDHTTVVHAVKTIEDLRGKDKDLAYDIDFLKKMLES